MSNGNIFIVYFLQNRLNALFLVIVFTQTHPAALHEEPVVKLVGNVSLTMTELKDSLPGNTFSNF